MRTTNIWPGLIALLPGVLAVEGAILSEKLSGPEQRHWVSGRQVSLGGPSVNADGTLNVRIREMPTDTRVVISGVDYGVRVPVEIGGLSVKNGGLPVSITGVGSYGLTGRGLPVRLEEASCGLLKRVRDSGTLGTCGRWGTGTGGASVKMEWKGGEKALPGVGKI